MSVVIGLSSAVAVALAIVAACFIKNRAMQVNMNSTAALTGQGSGSVQYHQLQPTYDIPGEGTEQGGPANEYAVYAHWPTVDPATCLPPSLVLGRDKERMLRFRACS